MKTFIIKITVLLLVVISTMTSFSCTDVETLYFLNWGEYINDDLLVEFEEQYHCHVVMDIVESNELFYAKVQSGTTAYDLVNPGEYMIEKMYTKGLIQEFDFSLLPNYKDEYILNPVLSLEAQMDKDFPGVNKYHIPYFWGSFGIPYNRRVKGLEELMYSEDGGWNLYFNPEVQAKLDETLRVGVYSVSRFIYASVMLYKGLDPNILNDEQLQVFEDVLMNMNVDQWGTDILKKEIESGNLDLAYSYTGDTLDMIYLRMSEGTAFEDLKFETFIPENTILHMDTFAIPSKARHYELAHKFVNFLYDPDNAFRNAEVVGYCTPLISVYEKIVNKDILDENSSAEDIEWYTNWAKAVAAHYPMDEEGVMHVNGVPLTFFDKDELAALENVVNKVKVKNR